MKNNKAKMLVAVVAISLITTAFAADKKKPAAETKPDARASIEKSIHSYVAAYNAHDAVALAAHWSPEGVYHDRTNGSRVTGRADLEKEFKEAFKAEKTSRLEVKVESIELVSPSVAIEQGVATISNPDGTPSVSSYNAVHVKREGKWLVDRVSEEEIVPTLSHFEHLKDLEWMIGDWIDQDDESAVVTKCHWARNDNHIVRSFTVSIGDRLDMAGVQIIGWDPARKQIRSWVFDSDGGFTEGTWKKIDNRWTVQNTATLPDGTRASSTSIMKPVDKDSFTWQQIDRVVGSDLLPDIDEFLIVRSSPASQ